MSLTSYIFFYFFFFNLEPINVGLASLSEPLQGEFCMPPNLRTECLTGKNVTESEKMWVTKMAITFQISKLP